MWSCSGGQTWLMGVLIHYFCRTSHNIAVACSTEVVHIALNMFLRKDFSKDVLKGDARSSPPSVRIVWSSRGLPTCVCFPLAKTCVGRAVLFGNIIVVVVVVRHQIFFRTTFQAQARASAVPTEEVVRKSESAASGTVKSLAARTTNTTNNGGQPQKPFGTSEDEPDKKRRKTPEKETLLKNVGRDFADPPPVPSDVQKDGEHGRVETNEREEESSAEVLGASACLVEEGVVSEEKEEVVAADVEEPKNVLIERTMLVEEPDKTVLVEDPKNVLVEDLVVEKTEIQDPFENDSSSGNGSAGAEGAPSLSPLKVRRSPQPASIRGEVEPAAHTQDADKMELVTPAETPATHTHAVGHGDLPSDGSHAASSAEVTVTAEPILLDRGRRGTDVPEAPLSETTRMSEAQQRLVAPPHSGGPAEEDAAMTNNNAGGEAEQNPAAQKPHKNFDEAPPESCPGADQAACTGDEHDIPITDADGDIEMSQEEADEDGAEGLIQKEGGEGEREEDVDVAMAVDHHP